MISVLLPYRDAASTLAEALESVAADPLAEEIVLVDDGSRDEGPAIAARTAARDRRFVCITGRGEGIAQALADGLSATRGDLVARMDADDVSLPGRIAACVDLLANDATLGAVGTRVRGFPASALGEGMTAYLDWQNALMTKQDHARDLFVESPLCHPSTVIRRRALDEVGGFRACAWPEDYDLWMRLDAAGWGLAKADIVGLAWRHHDARVTFTDPRCAPPRLVEARAHYLAQKLAGRPFAIWGAGKTGKRLARALEAHDAVPELFADIDPEKIGRRARDRSIVPVEALLEPGAPFVVVAVGARGARDEVRARLTARGSVETVDFLCAS